MDPVLLSAAAGLIGSLVGGVSTSAGHLVRPADRLSARSCIGTVHLTRGAQIEMDFVLCLAPP